MDSFGTGTVSFHGIDGFYPPFSAYFLMILELPLHGSGVRVAIKAPLKETISDQENRVSLDGNLTVQLARSIIWPRDHPSGRQDHS